MNKFTEPFEHIIIDNFFPEDIFKQVKSYMHMQSTYTSGEDGHNGLSALKPALYYSKAFSFATANVLNEKFMIENFNLYKTFKTSIPDFRFNMTQPGFEYIKHVDSADKLMSLLVYISPTICSGTRLYDNNKKFIKEIEWVENRALLFCPSNESWHDFCNLSIDLRLVFLGTLRITS